MTCWTSSSYSKIAHPALHQHTARTFFSLSLTVCRLSVTVTLFHYYYFYSKPVCPRPRCPRPSFAVCRSGRGTFPVSVPPSDDAAEVSTLEAAYGG